MKFVKLYIKKNTKMTIFLIFCLNCDIAAKYDVHKNVHYCSLFSNNTNAKKTTLLQNIETTLQFILRKSNRRTFI